MSGPDPRSGVDEQGKWTPVFPEQRSPFEKGHRPSVRHGAHVKILLPEEREECEAIAQAIREAMLLGLGYSEADEPAVQAAAMCAWRLTRIYSDLDENGVLRNGDPAPLLRHVDTTERTLQRWCDRLGLHPVSRAELRQRGAVSSSAWSSTMVNLARLGDDDLDQLHAILERAREGGDG
jgi:hypothetical protein